MKKHILLKEIPMNDRKEVREKLMRVHTLTKEQLRAFESLAEPIQKSIDAQRRVLSNNMSFEEYFSIEERKAEYIKKFIKLIEGG